MLKLKSRDDSVSFTGICSECVSVRHIPRSFFSHLKKIRIKETEICLHLPSDSTSRWTPLVLAVSFPLPGRIRNFHPLATCAARRTRRNKEAGITRLPFFSYQQQLLFPHPQKNRRRIIIQQQLSPPNPHPSLFPQNARRMRIQIMLLLHPFPLKSPNPLPLHPHPQSRS